MSSYHYSFYSPTDYTADTFFNNGFIGFNGFLLLGNFNNGFNGLNGFTATTFLTTDLTDYCCHFFNNGFNGLIGLSLTVAEVSGLRSTKSDCNDWYYRLLRRQDTSATDGAPIESV